MCLVLFARSGHFKRAEAVTGLRLNTNYQLLNFQGEPDLRGEPAASGAEKVYKVIAL